MSFRKILFNEIKNTWKYGLRNLVKKEAQKSIVREVGENVGKTALKFLLSRKFISKPIVLLEKSLFLQKKLILSLLKKKRIVFWILRKTDAIIKLIQSAKK